MKARKAMTETEAQEREIEAYIQESQASIVAEKLKKEMTLLHYSLKRVLKGTLASSTSNSPF